MGPAAAVARAFPLAPDDVAPQAPEMPKGPVKTRELAGDGYHRALTAHQRAAPPRLADPAITAAVARQTRAMRELSRRASPEPDVSSNDQPASIEVTRAQRRRQAAATEAAALCRAHAEKAGREVPAARQLDQTA